MDFDVDIPRLASVPPMLDRLAGDARECARYASKAFLFPFGPGVINVANRSHLRVARLVNGYFSTVAARADVLAKTIDTSAREYESVDTATAAHWDARLPAMDHVEGRLDAVDVNVPEAEGRELYEPARELKPLPDNVPDRYHPDWADLLSPTSIWRDAAMGINWLAVQIGIVDRVYDPLDSIALPWAGNWAGIRACSEALRNLASACNEMRQNCMWIEQRVNAVWQGNAADAAWLKLNSLTRYLETGPPAFEHYSGAYADVVDEMQELEKVVEFAVIEYIDAAMLATVAVATAPTVVGPPVVGVASAVKIVRTIEKLSQALATVEALKSAIGMFKGKLDGYGALDIDLEGPGHLEVSRG